MDDLLITRLSDRSQERHARRRAHAPIGANLGFVLAAAFAVLIFAKHEEIAADSSVEPFLESPYLAAASALAVSLALVTLLGRFLKPSLSRRRKPLVVHYDGFPHTPAESETRDVREQRKSE